MRKTEAGILALVLLMSSCFVLFRYAKADNGEAKVYIIRLDGVPRSCVGNTSLVTDGVIDACMSAR